MVVQSICKNPEQHNDTCCQNINLVFPSGVGMITGTATSVDLNSNSGNPCGNQNHPTFDATLFSPQEMQFGLHIKNKINKWNFSQIANLDSVSLIFETVNSNRKLNIYDDKITIDDGNIESPIVTLTDLLTIGLIDDKGNSVSNPVNVDFSSYAKIDYVDAEMTELKNENILLEARVTDLETEVVNLKQQISDILNQVSDILNQI